MNNATVPKNKKKEKVVKEVRTVTKNIVLEGVNTLRAERVKTTYKLIRKDHPTYKIIKKDHPKSTRLLRVVSKEKIAEEVEPLKFPLVEVSAEALADYRNKGVPSFVLKVDGKLYHATIPDNISFVGSTILGAHQCAVAGHECHRLSAASDEEGGCEKVRNHANYIERYPWITNGYETFNTRHDSFVVAKCLHYVACPPRKHFTATEVNRAKLSLAQFLWEDVENLAQVRARKAKNKELNNAY